MIRARWQGFEVESGESPVSTVVANWNVLKQGLVFVLLSIPILAGLGTWLARLLLKPYEQPMPPFGAAPTENPEEPPPHPLV